MSIYQRPRALAIAVSVSEIERWPFTPPPRPLKLKRKRPDIALFWKGVFVALALETIAFAVACWLYLGACHVF